MREIRLSGSMRGGRRRRLSRRRLLPTLLSDGQGRPDEAISRPGDCRHGGIPRNLGGDAGRGFRRRRDPGHRRTVRRFVGLIA